MSWLLRTEELLRAKGAASCGNAEQSGCGKTHKAVLRTHRLSSTMTSNRARVSGRLVFFLAPAFVLLASFAAIAGEVTSHPRVDEAEVIKLVLKREIAANHLVGQPVCVGFNNGDDPPKGLLKTLRNKGVRVRAASWCHENLRGWVIYVGPFTWSEGKVLEVGAETGDINLDGADVGTLLRRGTYVFTCGRKGACKLVTYRMTCCDAGHK